MNNLLSELDVIQKLPYDLQIELSENEYRKDWTQSEKAYIQKILRKLLQKETHPGARTDLVTTSAKHLTQVTPHKDTRINSQIGKLFGESHETVRKRDQIFDEINKYPKKYEHIKKSIDSGKSSISTAYTKIIKFNPNLPKVCIPKGKYNVLEIDFPWGYKDQAGSKHRANSKIRYPTEPPSIILGKYVPKFCKIVSDDAVLFMWVTTPLLNEIIQLQILEKLGFSYKTMISWHKLIPKKIFGGKGMGYWFRGEMEHCMVGIKGNIKPFRCKLPNFIESPITKDSEKPIQFKELFEEATKNIPSRKMFEGYARRARKNWTGFGNQLKVITS